MRFAHISDLHIGKRVNDFSMLEDQQYILKQILDIIKEQKVDAVVIAGDVYDKSVPSAEAVALCDDFITALSREKLQTFMISGNHDCAERVAFGARIMEQMNLHIAPVFDGNVLTYQMKDQMGNVNFYLLPFLKPANVRRFYEEETINSYTDAMRTVISHIDLNTSERNVLIAHQFVTGAARSDSEDVSVGGIDNVDADVFDAFDYVALGHIHGAQKVIRDTIRYCGTPLKYSFSEAKQNKSVTIVTMDIDDQNQCEVAIDAIPLKPLRDLREIRGSYEEITLRENYLYTNTQDYMHITLTDEEDIPDAIGKLRAIYPNIMKLDYDNKRTRTRQDVVLEGDAETKSPLDLFEDFYYQQNNQQMSEQQQEYISQLVEKIWEDRV